jgi:hypothetical protein
MAHTGYGRWLGAAYRVAAGLLLGLYAAVSGYSAWYEWRWIADGRSGDPVLGHFKGGVFAAMAVTAGVGSLAALGRRPSARRWVAGFAAAFALMLAGHVAVSLTRRGQLEAGTGAAALLVVAVVLPVLPVCFLREWESD